ncbi:hypothetical protein F4824DRAFT_478343 [Ustulina deusta]|nr:hypothetical protein F4824DRAFT_478343 [Ustulina deusta]
MLHMRSIPISCIPLRRLLRDRGPVETAAAEEGEKAPTREDTGGKGSAPGTQETIEEKQAIKGSSQTSVAFQHRKCVG